MAELGITLDPGQRAAIDAQARLLVAWGGAINLTAHRTPAAIALEHVIDSLTALEFVRGAASLLDLGSGAGYPGVPLAICLSPIRTALVDSIGKKARFLEVVADAVAKELGTGHPPPIAVVRRRAEELAREPANREAWDVVTCRAVAAMPELIALALPLLRRRGRLIAWKRDDGSGAFHEEMTAARETARTSGGTSPEIHQVAIVGLEDHRLVVVHKRRPMPVRW